MVVFLEEVAIAHSSYCRHLSRMNLLGFFCAFSILIEHIDEIQSFVQEIFKLSRNEGQEKILLSVFQAFLLV